ncbi:MAG: hypothetical protein COA58_08400 [Bacteroidetes bacterium]|nr:MAG: hypothetical protein COA58_08400 [Bacteroidota bacterium]
MTKKYVEMYAEVDKAIQKCSSERQMPGLNDEVRKTLNLQFVDSIKRIKIIEVIDKKGVDDTCLKLNSDTFNPIKAIAWYKSIGNYNEAIWLIFLVTHFGKNINTNWNLLVDTYSGARVDSIWNWESTSTELGDFLDWLNLNEGNLKKVGKFGNHRKYQSISAVCKNGTGDAFTSYINWIGEDRDQLAKLLEVTNSAGNSFERFDMLYSAIKRNVNSFGRMATFDFCTMLGKFRLLDIEPGHTYLAGATGPVSGLKTLFGNKTLKELDEDVMVLYRNLNQFYGMQIIEDAICNWQKSTAKYRYFGG